MNRNIAAVLFLALVGCSPTLECDIDSIQAFLDAAQPGEEVVVGQCAVSGSLSVPAGVALVGAANRGLLIESDGVALTMASGSRVSGVTAISTGCAVVVVRDDNVEIDDVQVSSFFGVGIAVDGVMGLRISNTDVMGTAGMASAAQVPLPPYRCDPTTVATHGVLVYDSTDVAIESSSVAEFGAFGILGVDADVNLTDTQVLGTIGTSVAFFGGAVDMTDVTVSGSRQFTSPIESFGALFADATIAKTNRLSVRGGEVFGAFHERSQVEHIDFEASDNKFSGAWFQSMIGTKMSGAATLLDQNGFGGVVLVNSPGADIESAVISGTQERTAVLGGTSSIMAGDGIHAIGSVAGTRLSGLTLTDNERVGLLLDLNGESTSALNELSAEVTATGTQLGVVAQNGNIDVDWDSRVLRMADAAANDSAFSGTLIITDAVGPSCLPPAESVRTGGVDAIILP